MRRVTLVVALVGDVDAVAVGLVVLPLPHVFLPLLVLPEAVPFHGSVLEVAHVVLLVEAQQAVSLGFVVDEVPVVD